MLAPQTRWAIRRRHTRCSVGRIGGRDGAAALLLAVLASAGISADAEGLAAGPMLRGVTQERVTIPLPPPTDDQKKMTTACDLPRTDLSITVQAHNPELYPEKAERIETGWLVYDEYQEQVIQVDDQLVEVRRLGQKADGPLEYGSPAAFFSMAPGDRRIGILDRRPSSFMWMDDDGTGNEVRIDVPFLHHAVLGGDRMTMVAGGSSEGGVFEMPVYSRSRDSVRTVVTWSDIGLSVSPEMRGQPPMGLLRMDRGGQVYLGIVSQSSVWAPDPKEGFRKIVQRCVPPVLTQLHIEAFQIQEGLRVNIVSMRDFLVLAGSRILTLGGLGLSVDDDVSGRSIEMYDRNGERLGAWRLPVFSYGTFDPSNPHRLLVWGGIDGMQVVEVSSDFIW